jgi:Spy/CpxP family protein refolding chaperone
MLTFLWMGTIPIQAEVYGPPGNFGWQKSVPLHLVLHAAVVYDIGLNKEAAGKLKDLQRRVQADFEEALAKARSSDDPKSRIFLPKELVGKNPEILHTIRIRYAEQIDSLLTTEQQMRLHQIHLQYGTFASDARLFCLGSMNAMNNADVLSDSAVAKELELTDAQRQEIRSIHMAITRAEGAKVKMGKSYNGPNYHDLEIERSEKIMKVLTSVQREAFQKLKGKPLKIDLGNALTSP